MENALRILFLFLHSLGVFYVFHALFTSDMQIVVKMIIAILLAESAYRVFIMNLKDIEKENT